MEMLGANIKSLKFNWCCKTRLMDVLNQITAELQRLEHLWNHEKMLKAGVVRANEY